MNEENLKSIKEILLKEVDRAIITLQNTFNESIFREERIEGLKIAKEIIKKHFPNAK